ncbi:MAG TPA: caspase family protein [Acidimicrobiales bacterium]|nr:caspase family protein [Acidimicrobiales bacterium]
MAKKALCVGVNDYPVAGMDLKGCVNDATQWARLLTEHYDFVRRDVTVVVDADATHDRIIAEVKALLAGASAGDVLVFTNSSHGTYLADAGAEEADRYDEAICPWDCKEQLLSDDELRELFASLGRGVRLAVISDSCHSGSVTRAAPAGLSPDDRRVRFLHPSNLGRPAIEGVRAAVPRRRDTYPESQMKELLLSGCPADQYSFDAKIDDSYHGAMSYFARKVIEEAEYRITWSQLARKVAYELRGAQYDQEPQLEGRAAAKRRQIFT